MTDTKNLTCIICPMGCSLEVKTEQNTKDGTSYIVSGNSCPRGATYAKEELTCPKRTLTCTVAVKGGTRPLVSARTKGEVPKQLLLDCMQAVKRLTLSAPVKQGQIIACDLLHTGIDLIACEDINDKN